MRTLHPDTLAALKTDHLRAILVKFDYTPYPVYLSNTPFDVEYQGDIYLGNGQLLGLDKLSQSIDIRVSTSTVSLDAIDPAHVAILLGNPQHGRSVSVALAILNNQYQVQGEIIRMNSMIIDGSPSIDDDPSKGEAKIKQKLSSEFANWEATNGRRTTPASQQRYFPNDTGFDFAAESGKEVKWGRK